MSAPLDVGSYLARIGAPPRALPALHQAHLLHVPFENLSIHRREAIELRADWLHDKIVRRRRGGFCYELNGLFAELLLALGHRVDRLAARVYKPDGALGIPFDHLCLRVDGDYLADVGFGDCFMQPLRIDHDGEQHDGRTAFRIQGDDLWMRDRDGGWQRQYHFERTAYDLADFEGGSRYHQTSPESGFTQKRVCSMATPRGRITLRDDRLIERTEDGVTETALAAGDWERLLAERFGVAL